MKSNTVIDLHNGMAQIKQGKPCFSMTVKKYKFQEEGLHHILIDNNLNYLIEKLDEHWDVLYIYDDPQMLEIIRATPDIPTTKYDHWVLGNLFGYSHEAIMKFIRKV